MARKASATPPEGSGKAPTAKPKRVSRKTTPSPETLAPLGPDRLIALILDETGRNPAFRKLVSAAIAGLQGPDAVAALVDRRLTALERARGLIDWQKRRAFAADLNATIGSILRELVPLDRGQGLDRLLRFLLGAKDVFERVDDPNGQVARIYEEAADKAAEIARTLPPAEAAALALRLVTYLPHDLIGSVETMLLALMPGLPDNALGDLDAALAADAEAVKPRKNREWSAELAWLRLMRLRQALADRSGDADGFIAIETALAPERANRVAIAERLLAAGRPVEALDWIRRQQKPGIRVMTREALMSGAAEAGETQGERVAIEARILDTLGQGQEAQALRWSWFEDSLERQTLRDYLAKLPDFEDEEALERAFDHAAAHPQPYRALNFLVRWPNLDRAARLVEARASTWEGDRYEVLGPAAEALAEAYPIAASRLYRLLIEDILDRGRSAAYGHAARYLGMLDALADRVAPGSLKPEPADYRELLRKGYGRKSAFWALVKG